MISHPLFKGFINSGLVEAGAALGFKICIVSSVTPLLPMTDVIEKLIGTQLDRSGGHEGFHLVAYWQAPGVFNAAFAKPLTDVASALYLVGLGSVARDEHKNSPVSYRVSHGVSHGLEGCYDSRGEAAEWGMRAAARHGQSECRTHRVRAPLASWLYTGADIMQDLSLSAYQHIGPEADGWPQLSTDEIGQFAEAQALLIDGFAWHSGNMPKFVVCEGEPVRHPVGTIS